MASSRTFFAVAAAAAGVSAWAAAPLSRPLAVDAPAVAVDLREPGRAAWLVFTASAGQRLGLGLDGLALAPSSASGVALVVRQPDGSALPATVLAHCLAEPGREARCDAEFTVERTGRHVLEVEPPFSAGARFTATLSSVVSRRVEVGKSETLALGRVGQDGRAEVELGADSEASVEVRDVAGGSDARFAVRVYRPDGSRASELLADARGASVALTGGPGTYIVEIDPDRGGTGRFDVTVQGSPQLTFSGEPRAFASSTDQVLRFGLHATAGQKFVAAVDSMKFTPEVDSNIVIAVEDAGGKRVSGIGCSLGMRARPCKILVSVPATGKYTIVIRSPARASVSGRLLLAEELAGTLEGNAPVRIETRRPAQVARYSFPGKAGDKVSIAMADVVAESTHMVEARLLRPDGSPMMMQVAMQGALKTNAIALPVTGTYTVLIDPGVGTVKSGTLSIVTEAAP